MEFTLLSIWLCVGGGYKNILRSIIMLKWISKNQGACIAIVLNLCIIVWTFGCESKVQSLRSEKKVTRAEFTIEYNTEINRLQNEIQSLQETGQLSYAELDRLDAMKAKLFDFVAIATQTGGVNPIGLVTLLGTIAGIGLGVDNRIKDKVIKNRPLNKTIMPKTIT